MNIETTVSLTQSVVELLVHLEISPALICSRVQGMIDAAQGTAVGSINWSRKGKKDEKVDSYTPKVKVDLNELVPADMNDDYALSVVGFSRKVETLEKTTGSLSFDQMPHRLSTIPAVFRSKKWLVEEEARVESERLAKEAARASKTAKDESDRMERSRLNAGSNGDKIAAGLAAAGK
jgi:hypothetical protein